MSQNHRPVPARTGANSADRPTGTDLRDAILDEARRVLREQGYEGLSMRRIAASVHCTATSIYLYFANKDALIHALIDEGFDTLNARMAEARSSGVDTQDQLRRMSLAYIDFGRKERETYQVMFQLPAERMERYPADAYRRARMTLEGFAEVIGEARGTGADLSAASVAWSCAHGFVSLAIAHRFDKSLDQDHLAQATVDQICRLAH